RRGDGLPDGSGARRARSRTRAVACGRLRRRRAHGAAGRRGQQRTGERSVVGAQRGRAGEGAERTRHASGRAHQRRVLHDLCRRRGHRGDTDRVDRVLVFGPRADRLAPPELPGVDPGVAPHAVRSIAGARRRRRAELRRRRRAHCGADSRRPRAGGGGDGGDDHLHAWTKAGAHRDARPPGLPPDPQGQVRPRRSLGIAFAVLTELHVAELGIVADLTMVFGPGLTAITGETGAGKTLLVEAVELLVGGRADATLVRDGAPEARVEGRFVDMAGGEVVVARVVPLDGRSRAYIDGRLATVGELADV